MGEITVRAELENVVDCVNWADGCIPESQILRYELAATIDTGEVMLVLPQNVVEKLGVRTGGR